ncbi:MAG: hypothetical protein M3Y08_13435 [Fibrobacterota bacterium]|nr:hypothetical protein [Fibrobacterota bacterium]
MEKKANTARSLLKAASNINSIFVVNSISRDTLYRFLPEQVDSLKTVLKKSSVSESLLLTPPPWDIALVLESSSRPAYIALHYGDVLRLNSRNPWSPIIADSAGNSPAPGITDIVLDGDDVPWLSALLQKAVGRPPSNPHRVPTMPRLLDVE